MELETPDPNKVDRTAGQIFLDFSKMQLKNVHALKKAAVAEIRVRGSTLKKQMKHSEKDINKLKENMQRTNKKLGEKKKVSRNSKISKDISC